MTWKTGDEAELDEMLPDVPRPARVFAEKSEEIAGGRHISGEIRGFVEEDLRTALDSILRTINSRAALSEAILEIKCVRQAHPYAVPREALEPLALGLWKAGLSVKFGHSWTPLRGGEVAAVGVCGVEDAYALINELEWFEAAQSTL